MDPAIYAQSRVGATLRDKWTLERLLGVGGMAAVYVGVHKIGQRAAIKILHPDVARSAELRARFEQEAHAVNRFKHPGVVEIRDIDVTEDGAPFLVMELLDGTSLADLADRPSGVEPAEVLRLADDLLDVLVAAHAQGIVHRDIKPDNLFVLRDGRLKVLDFGIARVKDAALRTRAGAMLGTAPYMAPEQIRGKDIDARVDLFAVGATMFRLLARRRIHEAESEAELLVKMATRPAPPLVSVAPGVAPAVGLVVDRALAMDRDQRYPDAATMQADVRALRAPVAAAPAVVTPAVVVTPVAVAPAPDPPSLTVLALPPVAAAPVVAVRQRDETKIALIAALGLVVFILLALVVGLALRPAPESELPAPAPPPPPTDDPQGPAARDPDDAQDERPLPPKPGGWGKGRGHGKGKHKGRGD